MAEMMSVQEGQLESGRQVSVTRAGLQAGFIGLIVMTLSGLFFVFGPQFLSLVTCGLLFVILVVVGVLAGYFLGPARTGRKGAGADPGPRGRKPRRGDLAAGYGCEAGACR